MASRSASSTALSSSRGSAPSWYSKTKPPPDVLSSVDDSVFASLCLEANMLTEPQTLTLRQILLADRERLIKRAQQAIDFSMDRDRDRVGRDSMDESVEEAMYATELRLHDREKFLLSKIDEALD